MEIWANVKGADGWTVSTEGRVRYHEQDVITPIMPHGYARRRFGARGRQYVHRIIAETFCPNPSSLKEVDHINGDRNDNRAKNLQWITHSENVIKGVNTGDRAQMRGHHRPVVFHAPDGEIVFFRTIIEAAETVGRSPSSIRSALKYGLKCAGGRWEDAP